MYLRRGGRGPRLRGRAREAGPACGGWGAARLGLARGRGAGPERAATAGCDWPRPRAPRQACGRGSGREDRARWPVREPGGGAGAVVVAAAEEAVAAGAGTGPGGMSEAEAAVVATAAPAATVPATAAGVVAVVVPVPAGEPQKAGGGAGGGGGAASGPAAGTPAAPGPRTPGNPATAASGTPAPPARSQADKPVLGEGGGRALGRLWGGRRAGGGVAGFGEPKVGRAPRTNRSCSGPTNS